MPTGGTFSEIKMGLEMIEIKMWVIYCNPIKLFLKSLRGLSFSNSPLENKHTHFNMKKVGRDTGIQQAEHVKSFPLSKGNQIRFHPV